jgi:hypothetical protein
MPIAAGPKLTSLYDQKEEEEEEEEGLILG